jgi:hypothetical protein
MPVEYEPPELNEYGAVEKITECSGTNKVGSMDDENSDGTPLTGSCYTT